MFQRLLAPFSALNLSALSFTARGPGWANEEKDCNKTEQSNTWWTGFAWLYEEPPSAKEFI